DPGRPGREDRPRGPRHRTNLPEPSPQTDLLAGVPRAVPDLRDQPELRGVRLRRGAGRPPPGPPAPVPEEAGESRTIVSAPPFAGREAGERRDAESQTTPLQGPARQAPRPRRPPAAGNLRLPQLPGAQAPAPRLSALRPLQ